LRFVKALRSEDFPTFERPAKAISGGPGGGSSSDLALANMNLHGPAKRRRPDSAKSGSIIVCAAEGVGLEANAAPVAGLQPPRFIRLV
jgi:hypothetical protein